MGYNDTDTRLVQKALTDALIKAAKAESNYEALQERQEDDRKVFQRLIKAIVEAIDVTAPGMDMSDKTVMVDRLDIAKCLPALPWWVDDRQQLVEKINSILNVGK